MKRGSERRCAALNWHGSRLLPRREHDRHVLNPPRAVVFADEVERLPRDIGQQPKPHQRPGSSAARAGAGDVVEDDLVVPRDPGHVAKAGAAGERLYKLVFRYTSFESL